MCLVEKSVNLRDRRETDPGWQKREAGMGRRLEIHGRVVGGGKKDMRRGGGSKTYSLTNEPVVDAFHVSLSVYLCSGRMKHTRRLSVRKQAAAAVHGRPWPDLLQESPPRGESTSNPFRHASCLQIAFLSAPSRLPAPPPFLLPPPPAFLTNCKL